MEKSEYSSIPAENEETDEAQKMDNYQIHMFEFALSQGKSQEEASKFVEDHMTQNNQYRDHSNSNDRRARGKAAALEARAKEERKNEIANDILSRALQTIAKKKSEMPVSPHPAPLPVPPPTINTQNNLPKTSRFSTNQNIINVPLEGVSSSPVENLLKLAVFNIMKYKESVSGNVPKQDIEDTSLSLAIKRPRLDEFPDTISSKSTKLFKRTETIIVGIYPENPLENYLIKEDMEIILDSIMDIAIRYNSPNFRPQFFDRKLVNGHIDIECANEETVAWLKANLFRFKTPKTINSLILSDGDYHHKRAVILGLFERSVDYEDTRILNIIDAMNEGLNARNWKIIQRIPRDHTAELVVSVDHQTMELLEDNNGKIFYRFETITLVLLSRSFETFDEEKEFRSKQQLRDFDCTQKITENGGNDLSFDVDRLSPPWIN